MTDTAQRAVEVRALPFDLELLVRDGEGGDGRTLVGRLVPYGVASTVSDGGGPAYRERFTRGAFERQLRSGQHRQVALFAEHNVPGTARHLPLARAAELYDGDDGLFGTFPMPRTTAADDALELIRAGVVSGLSVGFILDGERSRRGRDGVVERSRAHLDHVALTHAPAYAGAEVVALRAAGALPGDLEGRADLERPLPLCVCGLERHHSGPCADLGRPLAAWRRDLDRLRSAVE